MQKELPNMIDQIFLMVFFLTIYATRYQFFLTFHDEDLKIHGKSSPEKVLAYKDNYVKCQWDFT